MSALDAEATYDTPLRRIRSTGDVPRRPSPIHQFKASRGHSESDGQSGPAHRLDGQGPSSSTPAQNTRRMVAGPGPATSTSRQQAQAPPALDQPTSQSPPQGSPLVPPQHQQPHRSWLARAMRFFGIGRGAPRERRSVVTLYFTLFSGLVQIVVISIVLGLSGTRLRSPVQPGLTEWAACERPLGIWACIWVIRAILACSLNYWGFLRDRKVRQRLLEGASTSVSSQGSTPTAGIQQGTDDPRTNTPHPRESSDSAGAGERRSNDLQTTPQRDGETEWGVARATRELPYAQLYSRLTLLSSLLTLSWFLTAHILEYTSISSCRHSSPHIWWLIFSILCLMYLSILEVVLLSFVVFVVAPIIFLFWNIILICMGRHPIQTGHIIKPEIGKLSKSIVDRIPLVIYIPPPPEGLFKDIIAVPDPAHVYPPQPPAPGVSPSRKRFRFIRMLSHHKNKRDEPSVVKDPESNRDVEKVEPQSWEEHWERGDYPFVVLEGNRAACAICLMDFEEPRRLSGTTPINIIGTSTPAAAAPSSSRPGPMQPEGTPILNLSEPVLTVTREGEGGQLKLADAGEGVQPLRLLECGHVFHKTCLDPWLTDVSGRCPVCQRAVVLPELKKKERR